MRQGCFWLVLIAYLGLGGCRTTAPAGEASVAAGLFSETEEPLKQLPYTPSLNLDGLDRKVDPCVDFYQYSCGGWLAKNPIPAEQASWSVYGKLGHDTNRYLWGILRELARTQTQLVGEQAKLGQYFEACMDEAKVELRGQAPLMPEWQAIAGMQDKSELATLLARLHLVAGSDAPFFNFGAAQDFSNAGIMIANADSGGLGLPDRDYYLSEDKSARLMLNAYIDHIVRSFALVGIGSEVALEKAKVIVKIETALAKATLTQVERRDSRNLNHKFSAEALLALTPDFPWDQYFLALGVAFPKEINVSEPAFYKELQIQLQSRSLDELKSYLAWHVLLSRSPYLSNAFVAEHFAFYSKTLFGVPKLAPRWQRCVDLVDAQLGDALGQEFVRRNFSPKLKTQTLRMTTQIEQKMQATLTKVKWMSAATRKQALAKLSTVVNKVGYPDRWRDYGPFAVNSDDFYGNVQRGSGFEAKRQLGKIGVAVDRGEWAMTAQTVNAYYNPQMNDVNFPAAVLQPPLYDDKMDAAPNYGNTGGTIGHELIHGFDDSGRLFDAKGNLRDWWSAADGAEFNRRAQCLVDQFAEYTIVDDIKINSRLTLGEDVADLGGMILAYAAWQAEQKGTKSEIREGFTPEQRFFIGFGQWACENNRPENLRVNALTNPHSPGRYRINGVVVNLPDFARAFSCKPGQAMVKANKCKIW